MVAQAIKTPPAVRKTWAPSLGWEDPLEEGTTAHSRVLAWRITMDTWGCRDLDTTERLSTAHRNF